MEWAVEDAPRAMRRSRGAAVAAFLLVVTSLWLPWWVVAYKDGAGTEYARDAARLFGPNPVTHPWLPHAAGLVVVLAAVWLFVRLAGRSWLYEPQEWTRDLLIVAGLMAAALASSLFWPTEPGFWSTRHYSLLNATGDGFTQQAMAGLGWWCAVLALALLGVAWALARQR